jgi:tRNA modification GTPase
LTNILTSSEDTIIALASAAGTAAIAVVRLSGENCIELVNRFFRGKDLTNAASHTLHFGTLRDGKRIIDEVLVSVFRTPNSFTKENSIEISTHGSNFIVKEVIQLFLNNGARYAKAGEFTQRAFLNGRFDLAQAEAVADLISAESEAAHSIALKQMRGGFSEEIKVLRSKLVDFASLLELELDFGEEDVEFANRKQLQELVLKIRETLIKLIDSFDMGNAIKNGIPIVIAGKPNAGKSTLLNALLNEEKAIVSSIAGTTRDFIEDELVIEGINFRFTDTAGLRKAKDEIEAIGVERSQQKMQNASLILYLFDVSKTSKAELETEITELKKYNVPYLLVGNHADKIKGKLDQDLKSLIDVLISASKKENLDKLRQKLLELVNLDTFKTGDPTVTNLRHFESLKNAKNALVDVLDGIENQQTSDLLAFDLRDALESLGEITGEVTNDEILGNIFGKFCIGK